MLLAKATLSVAVFLVQAFGSRYFPRRIVF